MNHTKVRSGCTMDRKILGDKESGLSGLYAREKSQAEKERPNVSSCSRFSAEHALKWIECDHGRKFLRGGAIGLHHRAGRSVDLDKSDPDIAELIAHAGEMEAGSIAIARGWEKFAWFLPVAPRRQDGSQMPWLRGFMVTQGIFRETLGLLNGQTNLTIAECRVLFQMIAGLSLRASAKLDGVSVETKRAHIKRCCAKLHCCGQKDLTARILSQLVYLFGITSAEHVFSRPFAAEDLPAGASLATHQLPNGRLLEVIECGPATGRPAMMVHATCSGSFGRLVQHLNRLKIRLFIPVRAGPAETGAEHGDARRNGDVADAAADLAAFMEKKCLASGQTARL